MGLTFRLGQIPLGVFTDASNNVGIGASPSGTYKFEVTGTAKVSGILTLGSTISNGTYAYTLPSATGTLALTSDLSSYVPYTGATGAVNLGYNYLAASNLDIDGYSFGDGGALNFKQFASLAVKGSGYTSIGARSTNIFTFSYNQAGLTSKAFSFDVSGLTTSVYKTYLMPNANGTLALTSDLSSYLPLAGGTLTGALGGTSATFSGSVGVGSTGNDFRYYAVSSASGNPVLVLKNPTSGTLSIASEIIGDANVDSNSLSLRVSNPTNGRFDALTISSTGAATFSSSVGIGGAPTGTYGALSIFGSGISLKDDYSGKIEIGRYSAAFPNAYIKLGANANSLRITNNTDSADLVTILNTGNIGIGTSSPAANLSLSGTSDVGIRIKSGSAALSYIDFDEADSGAPNGSIAYNNGTNAMTFSTGGSNTERMRITSGGEVLINRTSSLSSSYKLQVSGINGGILTNATGAADANFLSSSSGIGYHFFGDDATNAKFYVQNGGSTYNATGVYGTISDLILKENVLDASPKLNDLLNLKVRNFNFIGEDEKQLGFIAQEFEQVFPSLIEVDVKTKNKTIKTSVLIPMLVKALQEQQKQIEELKLKIK